LSASCIHQRKLAEAKVDKTVSSVQSSDCTDLGKEERRKPELQNGFKDETGSKGLEK